MFQKKKQFFFVVGFLLFLFFRSFLSLSCLSVWICSVCLGNKATKNWHFTISSFCHDMNNLQPVVFFMNCTGLELYGPQLCSFVASWKKKNLKTLVWTAIPLWSGIGKLSAFPSNTLGFRIVQAGLFCSGFCFWTLLFELCGISKQAIAIANFPGTTTVQLGLNYFSSLFVKSSFLEIFGVTSTNTANPYQNIHVCTVRTPKPKCQVTHVNTYTWAASLRPL